MDVSKRADVEVEAVVTDDGGLLVPPSAVRGWELKPGRRVPVKVPPPRRKRRDMYGVLAGKVRDVPYEEFEEASREARDALRREVAAYRAALRAPDAILEIAPLDEDIALAVDHIPRKSIGDPFDRMIAATSLALAVPLVTTDHKLRKLSAVETIW